MVDLSHTFEMTSLGAFEMTGFSAQLKHPVISTERSDERSLCWVFCEIEGADGRSLTCVRDDRFEGFRDDRFEGFRDDKL